MKLGAFSVSLSVKNIEQSKVLYQKIGFEKVGGEQSQNWLILRNGDHTIDANIMTFNPGWDKDFKTLESFTDIRVLLTDFEAQGINIIQKSIDGESGPSSLSIQGPDGNAILIDQHV
jgi:hypothetical protein